jgi:hypothetical protein
VLGIERATFGTGDLRARQRGSHLVILLTILFRDSELLVVRCKSIEVLLSLIELLWNCGQRCATFSP